MDLKKTVIQDCMTNKTTPMEAIDAFLEILRKEFASNPELTYRVLAALPTEVQFDSGEASKFVSPIEIVANKSDAQAAAALEAFTTAQLKKMSREANLTSADELKSSKKDDAIDLIIERARRKIAERSS